MTGPEHYREAERLLEGAVAASKSLHELPDGQKAGVALATGQAMANLLSQAQVHATLVLTAAMALEVTATLAPPATQAGADWRKVLTPDGHANKTEEAAS